MSVYLQSIPKITDILRYALGLKDISNEIILDIESAIKLRDSLSDWIETQK